MDDFPGFRFSEAKWDLDSNTPTERARELIAIKRKELLNNFAKFGMNEDNLVECSAMESYNLSIVFDKFNEIGGSNVRSGLQTTLKKIKDVSYLVNAKEDLRNKILGMEISDIKSELDKRDLNKSYRYALEQRLKEISPNNKKWHIKMMEKLLEESKISPIIKWINPQHLGINEPNPGFELKRRILKDIEEYWKINFKTEEM